MHIAEAVVREKGTLKNEQITHGWWNRFLQRQGDLSIRRDDSTANVRMDGFRTCGVYPFNPAAISVPEEPESGNGDEESGDEDSNSGDNDDDNGGVGSDRLRMSSVHCYSDDSVKGMTLILTLIIFGG